ncbi:MAG: ATP-dependent RecD-like DNA helicase [Deltaproteobacteria bacterium]|nr:ATP-dependent RecD-like DNA helicase [Deltaproteobacteria bacterium]
MAQRRGGGTENPLSLIESPVELAGTLERVVFHNPDNGYTVLRLSVKGKADLVTAVGAMHEPQPGVSLKLAGRWTTHARFGEQFQMDRYETVLPATEAGIRHYLASGLIKGVREAMAKRIVDMFGADTFRVMEEDPEQLLKVPGIGMRTVDAVRAAWAEHQGIRELIMFLQPHGVSTAYAVRIYKHYGGEALDVVRENPYRLAMDIHGIGFLTADAIAMKLGFEPDSALRAEAGLLYTLVRLSEEGHVYYPKEDLLRETATLLNVETALAERALAPLAAGERIVLEELRGLPGQAPGEIDPDDDRVLTHVGVYLGRYHHCEAGIAYYLRRILRSPKAAAFDDPETVMAKTLASLSMELAPEQEEAVRSAIDRKVMVITGGPGTGKTTVINAVIKAFSHARARILLAAPTGRAAKRLSETSSLEAKTIHRLLEYSPHEDSFCRNEDNPLACTLLVIDEASMMDTLLMYHLLKAVPLGATVIFVGDVNQLPSVGPGNVLRDIIASGVVPVVELTEVFRQAAESEIILNAHRINHGEAPNLANPTERLGDFYFIRQDDPEKAAAMVVDLVRDHIPRRFGLNAFDDIQVLSPMHKGSCGAANLNALLQDALNPQALKLQRGDRQFRLGDKVMQIRNNYDKDVFNGDIGRIIHVHPEDREITVRFDEMNVIYPWDELDELVPAYAISVHKSQGSEYPAVVLPILTQHYVMLQRNLLYTGVTRGKRLVVLVGSAKAVHIAVANNQMRKRHTWLAHRLAAGV